MRRLYYFFMSIMLLFVLFGCGKRERDPNTLVIGASSTPHAEILEHVKPKLEAQGIKLKIITFNDYVLPNKALEEDEIDANYFQHIPFFNLQVNEYGYDFVNAGGIHLEPMGLYSKRWKSVKDIPDGASIILSNSESDWGRVLSMLQKEGLIQLKSDIDITTADFDDIIDNPKQLTFKHSLDPEILATAYDNDEGDLVAINANFATNIGLIPDQDALILEPKDSPYANIIAVRSEDKDRPQIKALIDALQDKEVQDWMVDYFNGVVYPASN